MTHPKACKPSSPTADAEAQAASWLARSQGGGPADAESESDAEPEFKAWLADREENRHAFEALSAVATRVRGLPAAELASLQLGLQRDLAALDAAEAASARPRPDTAGSRHHGVARRPPSVWRWMTHASASLASIAFIGTGWLTWSHWQAQPTFSQSYATQRGQQLDVALPDGSRLHLDTATRLEVTLYRHRREVRLAEGQAMFEVASAAAGQGSGSARPASMPFTVRAGSLDVRVLGTRFSVRHTASGLEAGGVSVAVQEGHVRVSPTAEATTASARSEPQAPAQPGHWASIDLIAGQRVSADADGRLGEMSRIPPDTAAPWRDHRVSFENTPLAQALAEFERYGPTGLRVTDPQVAALRLGGSFDLRRLDRFAAALPQMLPVRLKHGNGQTEIISSR